MFCRWCGSEIPDDLQVCPHCGESLKREEKNIHESDKIALEKDVITQLLNFFNKNERSAFSMSALQNRLEEIIKDTKTREFGSKHLHKILNQMVQNGDIKSNLHNNKTHYHISDAHQKKPYKTIYSNEKPKKPTIKATPRTEPRSGAVTVDIIILGIIGGILFIAGLVIIFVGGTSGSLFSVGITLAIIGFIIFALSFTYITNGGCCECCVGSLC